jgi:hypothetical protein
VKRALRGGAGGQRCCQREQHQGANGKHLVWCSEVRSQRGEELRHAAPGILTPAAEFGVKTSPPRIIVYHIYRSIRCDRGRSRSSASAFRKSFPFLSVYFLKFNRHCPREAFSKQAARRRGSFSRRARCTQPQRLGPQRCSELFKRWLCRRAARWSRRTSVNSVRNH